MYDRHIINDYKRKMFDLDGSSELIIDPHMIM